jgi:hypothetical protein
MTVSELMDKLSKMPKDKEVLIFTFIDYENTPCGEFYESISGVIEDKNSVVISHE